ncbi:hypothetical protein ABMX48_23640 [Streptomyces cavourensis]
MIALPDVDWWPPTGTVGLLVRRSPTGSVFGALLVLDAYGSNQDTGDAGPDIVGFGGPGVYVARNIYRRFRTR